MFLRSSVVARLMLVTVMATVVNLSGSGSGVPAVSALACSSACNGAHIWLGGMIGAKTRMSQVSMYVSPGTIDNKLRVSDGTYYVDAGIRGTSGSQKWYFFSDLTPSAYYFNYLVQVPSSETGTLYISIWKNPNSWSIELDSYSGSYYWAGYSTPNFMNADEIWIGQRNQSSGASSYASTAYWRDNYWKSQSTGTWLAQTRPGSGTEDIDLINPPVQAGWNTKPSSNSTGGIWRAYTPQ